MFVEMKRAVFFVAALLIGGVVLADMVIGNLSRATVTNGTLGEVLAPAQMAASIDKIGDGVYSIPVQNVLSRSPVEVNVHKGTLAIVDDGSATPSVSEPTAVLNKALLWMEASTNVVADEDGYVSAWYDVREKNTE